MMNLTIKNGLFFLAFITCGILLSSMQNTTADTHDEIFAYLMDQDGNAVTSTSKISIAIFQNTKGLISKGHPSVKKSCAISHFEMTRVAKNNAIDPVSTVHYNNKFNPNSARLMKDTQKGDTFYFDQIRCQCEGEKSERKLKSLVFKMD